MKIIDAHMHYYDIDKFYGSQKMQDMKILRLVGSRYAKRIILFLLWRWVILKMRPVVTAAVHRD